MITIMEALKQVTTSIKDWSDENKVAKIHGKGLSTNDYTTEEKEKLAKINAEEHGIIRKEGSIVTEECLKGMGIAVTSSFGPIQDGSGDPYPAGAKNLLPVSDVASVVSAGITWTNNYDGSWTVDGTATATSWCLSVNTDSIHLGVLPAGTYIASSSVPWVRLMIDYTTDHVSFSLAGTTNTTDGTVTFTSDGVRECVATFSIAKGKTVSNTTVFFQVERGSVATEFTPYSNIRPIIGRTGAKLTRCGKNLVPFTNTTRISNGVTFTPQADGRIYIKGTATGDAIYVIYGEWQGKSGISIPKGTNVKANTNLNGVFALIYGYMSDGSYKGVYSHYNTLPETITDTYVYLQVNSGVVVDGYFAPMLTMDGWATEYEPYQGDTFTLDFGKNLLNYNAWKSVYINNGTAVWENNGVTLTASIAADCYTNYLADRFPEDAKIPITPGQTITMSWEEDTNKSGIMYIFPNGTTNGMVAVNNNIAKKLSYTATSGVTFVTFRFGVQNINETMSYKNIQIEYGSKSTNYVPYNPDVIAQTGGTVYGGTLDWNKGLATDSMGYVAFDGTEPFADGGNVYYLNASYAPGIELGFLNANPKAVAVCSHFTQGSGGINSPESVGKFDLGGSIRFNKSGFATVDDFKAYLAAQHAAGTPVQIAYKLANPITIQLTPKQITALAGINNLYCNDGQLTADFNRDAYIPTLADLGIVISSNPPSNPTEGTIWIQAPALKYVNGAWT